MTIDGTSRADDRASCWVRVAQTWAGAGRGALFIPPRQPRVYGRHDVPDIERLTRLQARRCSSFWAPAWSSAPATACKTSG